MSQSDKRSRHRGKNFSLAEQDMLLKLLKPLKPIIDNKRSDSLSCQRKREAWEQLAQAFTYQTGIPRTWRTLKDKYKNLNTKLKMQGKRLEFESTASNCVLAVYGDEEDLDLDNLQAKQADDTGIQLTSKGEPIEEDSNLKGAQEEIPMATTPQPPPLPIPTDNLRRTVDAEKLVLIRMQQTYCVDENARAEKRASLEMKNLVLKNQILELELEEGRQRAKRLKGNIELDLD